MKLLSQIRQLLSGDQDFESSTPAAHNKIPVAKQHGRPIDAGRESAEPASFEDDDLTVPELPIISEDIRLADDPVGFDPYDSAGKLGASD